MEKKDNTPSRRKGGRVEQRISSEVNWGRFFIALFVVAVLIFGLLFISTNWSKWFDGSSVIAAKDTKTVDQENTTVTPPLEAAMKTVETPAVMAAKTVSTEKPAEVSTEVPSEKPTEVAVTEPVEKSDVTPTIAPAKTTEKEVEATAAPAKETKTAAASAKKSGTAVSAVESMIKGTKDKVAIEIFTYEGGWKKDNDQWFLADEKKKEVPEAFAMAITGETWSSKITTWLKYAVSDPWSLTWFRFQMELEQFKDMNEANEYAQSVAELSSAKYDKLANETLTYFFEKLDAGSIEISKNWALEVMMRWQSNKKLPELFARRKGDTNHKPDLLVTFYDGDGKNFVSNKKAFQVACRAAGANPSDYSSKAYVNFTEGGTWKWKIGVKVNETPTPTPKPTPTPTPTPKPTPTPTPRPTKNPDDRPTPTVGGGPVNPENSEDPHTTDHVESTPVKPTPTPKPTPKPTPVPTAKVRPTENCEVPAPTPIREDKNTPPPADPGHNVPKEKPEGVADDSFDPDSI